MTWRTMVLLFGLTLLPVARAGGAAEPFWTPGADTLAISWRASTLTARVGERIVVRAAAAVADSATRLLGPGPGAVGSVEVLAGTPAPAGRDSAAWTLEMALFEVGSVDLSRLPFRLDGPGGSRPAALRDARITVEGTIPDTAGVEDLRDIKGPLPVPLGWRWGRIALGVLALAALAAALLLWRRRARRPVEVVRPEAPVRSPEEIALSALRELERAALPRRGLLKEHYVQLSGILRRYVEDRFRIPAVESTTEEIRRVLEGRAGRAVGGAPQMLALLEESDLVKFAKLDPGPEAAGSALARARTWIELEARPTVGEEADLAVR